MSQSQNVDSGWSPKYSKQANTLKCEANIECLVSCFLNNKYIVYFNVKENLPTTK